MEIKFKVDNIIKEGLMEDIKNTSVKVNDGIDGSFPEENHKENNVSNSLS